MWLGVWRRRRAGERKYEEFVRRYWDFLKEDIEYLCDRHHAEIHEIYDEIIRRDRNSVGRPLSQYSWVQAETLMDKLESAFFEWIGEETPGIGPKTLNARRRVRDLLKLD